MGTHPADTRCSSWDQYSALVKADFEVNTNLAKLKAEGLDTTGGIDTPFQGIGALNPRMGYDIKK